MRETHLLNGPKERDLITFPRLSPANLVNVLITVSQTNTESLRASQQFRQRPKPCWTRSERGCSPNTRTTLPPSSSVAPKPTSPSDCGLCARRTRAPATTTRNMTWSSPEPERRQGQTTWTWTSPRKLTGKRVTGLRDYTDTLLLMHSSRVKCDISLSNKIPRISGVVKYHTFQDYSSALECNEMTQANFLFQQWSRARGRDHAAAGDI